MRFLRSFSCTLALAAALVLCTAEVRAGEHERTSSLSWVRLPGAELCIGTRDLAQTVEERLGRSVFVSPTHADLFIEGRIEPAEAKDSFGLPGFRAHITVTDTKGAVVGTRDLDAPGVACRVLDDQLTLVISLFIDPDATLRAPPPAPTLTKVIVEHVFVPTPSPPARKPWGASLSIGPAFAVGSLPGMATSLSMRAVLVPPSLFPIEIGGAVWLDARAEPAGGSSSRGAIVSLSYGLLGGCPLTWSSGSMRLYGCADLEIGAMRAVGYGFTDRSGAGQERPIVQASVEGRVTRSIVGPLEIGLGLALVVPFRRERFFYLDADGREQELFRMAPLAGRAEIGLGLAFP